MIEDTQQTPGADPHPLGDPETTWITTYSGNKINPLAMTEDQVALVDVVHHLATTNRWGGAARFPISVARHSCLVAELVPDEFKAQALLHDGGEYALGDVVRPVKRCLSEFKTYEHRALEAVLKAFGVIHVVVEDKVILPDCVFWADQVALAWEWRDVVWRSHMGIPSDFYKYLRHVPDRELKPTTWQQDKDEFMSKLTRWLDV